MYEEQDEFEEEPEMEDPKKPDPLLDIVRPQTELQRTLVRYPAVQAVARSAREEALATLRGELVRLDADLNTKRRQRDDLDEMISLLAQGRITPREAMERIKS